MLDVRFNGTQKDVGLRAAVEDGQNVVLPLELDRGEAMHTIGDPHGRAVNEDRRKTFYLFRQCLHVIGVDTTEARGIRELQGAYVYSLCRTLRRHIVVMCEPCAYNIVVACRGGVNLKSVWKSGHAGRVFTSRHRSPICVQGACVFTLPRLVPVATTRGRS